MSVLLRPDFRKETVWYEIRTLDGRCLSRTHSLGHDGKWRWITDTIRGAAECDYEDIDVEETDDGDFITVKGKRYARCVMLEDFSDTPEHKQAMEEREAIVASAAAVFELARLKAKVAYLQAEVDTWRDRYEAADEALEQCIRDWNRDREEVGR
jgi:hypothetical protein